MLNYENCVSWLRIYCELLLIITCYTNDAGKSHNHGNFIMWTTNSIIYYNYVICIWGASPEEAPYKLTITLYKIDDYDVDQLIDVDLLGQDGGGKLAYQTNYSPTRNVVLSVIFVEAFIQQKTSVQKRFMFKHCNYFFYQTS